MAEKKDEQIYDGVGCPADGKSEKTIFHPLQKGDVPVVKDDGIVEKQRVIPPHAKDHSKVTQGGVPIRESGDTTCDQEGKIFGPIVRRDPPKTGPHPEKEKEKKQTPGFGFV